MTIKVLSDTALLVEVTTEPDQDGLRQVQLLLSQIQEENWPGVAAVVPSATAFAVYIRRPESWFSVASRLEELLDADNQTDSEPEPPRERVIPVCYRGEYAPDLERVALAVNLSAEEVIERHTAAAYTVLAVGFAPGFPYLSGLDAQLHCPRLPSPRVRVPKGAVGIGGSQTGIYPLELPGGWNLIGRTAQTLFEANAIEPSWLRVGDKVRFEAVDSIEMPEIYSAPPFPRQSAEMESGCVIEVLDGGAQTTVQDLGRATHLAQGVTEGGAVNRRGLRIANMLVGNDDAAAALEWAMRGPKLRFHDTRLVVITGTLARSVPFARPFVVKAGEVLDLTKLTEPGRGILAISGGLNVPVVLDSRSTHMSGRFGGWRGRALRKGDALPLGPVRATGASRGWWIQPTWVGGAADALTKVRVLKGPEVEIFGSGGWTQFLEGTWEIRSDSNRMGIRLAGEKILPIDPVEMISQPVATGTIQIPPNGQPIALMADRQTLGGYPRIASIIAVDMAIMAQIPLGRHIQFVETTLAEAESLRHTESRQLGLLRAAARSRLEFAG